MTPTSYADSSQGADLSTSCTRELHTKGIEFHWEGGEALLTPVDAGNTTPQSRCKTPISQPIDADLCQARSGVCKQLQWDSRKQRGGDMLIDSAKRNSLVARSKVLPVRD